MFNHNIVDSQVLTVTNALLIVGRWLFLHKVIELRLQGRLFSDKEKQIAHFPEKMLLFEDRLGFFDDLAGTIFLRRGVIRVRGMCRSGNNLLDIIYYNNYNRFGSKGTEFFLQLK